MPRIPGWLFYVVTLTVVGLWAVGIVLSFFSASFEMPPSLSTAVPIVLAFMFAAKAGSDSRRNGSDDDDG